MRFDNTINLGHILTFLGFLITIMVTWTTLDKRVVVLEESRKAQATLDDIAALISAEHGKVVADARGELQRGLEVVEFAVGIPHLLKGEVTENVGTNVDSHSLRQPLHKLSWLNPT